MKYLPLLLLFSCASNQALNQKEPWVIGDCAKYEPRGGIYKVNGVTLIDDYYYDLELIQNDDRPKVLTKIPCNSIKEN